MATVPLAVAITSRPRRTVPLLRRQPLVLFSGRMSRGNDPPTTLLSEVATAAAPLYSLALKSQIPELSALHILKKKHTIPASLCSRDYDTKETGSHER